MYYNNNDIRIEDQNIPKISDDEIKFRFLILDYHSESRRYKQLNLIDSHHKNMQKLEQKVIDLKKEIKVLRRERDHYKEIIKEHNLL